MVEVSPLRNPNVDADAFMLDTEHIDASIIKLKVPYYEVTTQSIVPKRNLHIDRKSEGNSLSTKTKDKETSTNVPVTSTGTKIIIHTQAIQQSSSNAASSKRSIYTRKRKTEANKIVLKLTKGELADEHVFEEEEEVQEKKLSPEDLNHCKQILHKLMKHDLAVPFNQPVDPISLNIPDYFDVIQRPMDFRTIKESLKREEYQSPADFAADIHLVFDNATTYNPVSHEVHQMAISLSHYFKTLYHPPSLNGESEALSGTEKDKEKKKKKKKEKKEKKEKRKHSESEFDIIDEVQSSEVIQSSGAIQSSEVIQSSTSTEVNQPMDTSTSSYQPPQEEKESEQFVSPNMDQSFSRSGSEMDLQASLADKQIYSRAEKEAETESNSPIQEVPQVQDLTTQTSEDNQQLQKSNPSHNQSQTTTDMPVTPPIQ